MTTTTHVTEHQWQAQVRELLALTGFDLTYCTWNSRHSPAGFPDLVALRDDQPGTTVAVLELKSERGRLRPAQHAWLTGWSNVAATVNSLSVRVHLIVGVFRPSDFPRLATLLEPHP
jgi:hypothetical protein